MDTFRQDLRFALRALRSRPGMTVLAVLCLSIGIGANTAIFSPVDVFMLRSLPYDEPHQLVVAWNTNEERGWTEVSLSVPDFLDYREQAQSVDLSAYTGQSFNVSGDGTERLSGEGVAYNFFRVMGTTPLIGRAFAEEDERPGAPRVAILSYQLWQRRFGGGDDIIGSTLRLDGDIYTVVGVMPNRFDFPDAQTEIFTPLTFDGTEPRASHYLETVGRVVAGSSIEQARAELSAIARRLEATYPESNAGNGIRVLKLRDELFGPEFREATTIATLAVALLLLIAAANVANLLLAQTAVREREIAVRAALGAGRSRIVRQLLTESLILGLTGGALGLALAYPGVKGLVALMPDWFPRLDEIGIDGRVVAYGFAVTLITGLLAGLAPALQTARQDLRSSLHEGGRGSSFGRRGNKLRNVFVTGQLALAVTLLVTSGLLIKGFRRLSHVDLGYDPAGVLTFRTTLPETKYPEDTDQWRFTGLLLDRLAALPGVEVAAATSRLPMTGNSGTYYQIEGEDVPEGRRPVVGYRSVSPEYFRALGTSVVQGRNLAYADGKDAPLVIVVNEAFVRRHWPDDDPLDRRVAFSSGTRVIVGVVPDIRESDLDQGGPAPMVYFPAAQSPFRFAGFVIRTDADPLALVGPVRRTVTGADADQPIYDVQTLQQRMQENVQANGVLSKIMLVLGGIALVLAVIGVYGVVSYAVSQRTQEIGVRMALGARGRDVVRMVVGHGGRTTLIGAAIGLMLAAGLSRVMSFFLFGVNALDPVTFGGAALALAVAALIASYLPARRASRVDPLIALRAD
jgi:putative ABC transport system permease protein